MDRTQFTFYESFFKAISRIRKKGDRAEAYDAICAYALYGTEPELEKLPDSAAIAFELSKPNLDASRRKANSGKRGGNAKQIGSKPEANTKQTQSKAQAKGKQTASKKEKEGEKENENEIEIENECLKYPSPDGDGTKAPLAAVMTAYLDKINPTPSQASLDELRGFVEQLGAECCLRAIDIALDEKKAGWSYIRAILRAKLSQGVRCLADWDALEERRVKRGAGQDQDTAQGAGAHGPKWDIKSALNDAD